jgi:predicted aspartyl protease
MSQSVESQRFPYLAVAITSGDHVETVEAVLDTGFEGDLAVPASFPFSGGDAYVDQEWAFADGSVVHTRAFVGTVRVGAFDPLSVLISVIGDEAIVGRGVIDRYSIWLDHGRRVVVER